MQVRKLVTRPAVAHASATFCLESLFVDDEAFIGDNSADFIFFLLATHYENLVVNLDRGKVFRKDLGVAQTDLSCRLRRQLVDH